MRILKVESLPSEKNWVDRDQIMLHSCFQILKDCIEKEKVDTDRNYEEHKDFVDEIRFLYKWWEERLKTSWSDNQHEEDDTMLLRLIKIRTELWT